jgi:ATP-dependent Clp protease ATP-binding subunit ClpA
LPDELAPGHVPFDSQAKKALELALREALALGHNYIGTEHILLGLLEHEESLGEGPLTGLGISKERARGWLVTEIKRIMEAKRRTG